MCKLEADRPRCKHGAGVPSPTCNQPSPLLNTDFSTSTVILYFSGFQLYAVKRPYDCKQQCHYSTPACLLHYVSHMSQQNYMVTPYILEGSQQISILPFITYQILMMVNIKIRLPLSTRRMGASLPHHRGSFSRQQSQHFIL